MDFSSVSMGRVWCQFGSPFFFGFVCYIVEKCTSGNIQGFTYNPLFRNFNFLLILGPFLHCYQYIFPNRWSILNMKTKARKTWHQEIAEIKSGLKHKYCFCSKKKKRRGSPVDSTPNNATPTQCTVGCFLPRQQFLSLGNSLFAPAGKIRPKLGPIVQIKIHSGRKLS